MSLPKTLSTQKCPIEPCIVPILTFRVQFSIQISSRAVCELQIMWLATRSTFFIEKPRLLLIAFRRSGNGNTRLAVYINPIKLVMSLGAEKLIQTVKLARAQLISTSVLIQLFQTEGSFFRKQFPKLPYRKLPVTATGRDINQIGHGRQNGNYYGHD